MPIQDKDIAKFLYYDAETVVQIKNVFVTSNQLELYADPVKITTRDKEPSPATLICLINSTIYVNNLILLIIIRSDT